MSNVGAPLPAGNSTSASASSANPDSVGSPPVTSPVSVSNSGTGRADQCTDDMSESVTSSRQPNGSSFPVPTPAPSPVPSPSRTPVPTQPTAHDPLPVSRNTVNRTIQSLHSDGILGPSDPSSSGSPGGRSPAAPLATKSTEDDLGGSEQPGTNTANHGVGDKEMWIGSLGKDRYSMVWVASSC